MCSYPKVARSGGHKAACISQDTLVQNVATISMNVVFSYNRLSGSRGKGAHLGSMSRIVHIRALLHYLAPMQYNRNLYAKMNQAHSNCIQFIVPFSLRSSLSLSVKIFQSLVALRRGSS